jgi:hypothetical protein
MGAGVCIVACIVGNMHGWINEGMNGCMDVWMYGYMDARTHGRMGE